MLSSNPNFCQVYEGMVWLHTLWVPYTISRYVSEFESVLHEGSGARNQEELTERLVRFEIAGNNIFCKYLEFSGNNIFSNIFPPRLGTRSMLIT